MRSIAFILSFVFLAQGIVLCQNWQLKISSNVELRSRKLTNKSNEEISSLSGATIKLLKAGSVVSSTTSDANGDFSIMVPANGNYVIEVSYPSCVTKKFLVNTTGVPPDIGTDDFQPTFGIAGFVLYKPFRNVDYSGLQSPLVHVVYSEKVKNFDDDETATQRGLGTNMKIYESEQALINNFCNTNKSGDDALKKGDCVLAKSLYEKALAVIPGEEYPAEQLAKADKCKKEKEEAEQKAKAAEEEKKKAAELAKQKEAELKAQKEKELAEKAEREKLEKAKADSLKAENAKMAAKKAEEEKLKKEKELAEKVEREKLEKAKADSLKAENEKMAAKKAEEEKLKKEKELAEKAERDKLEKARADSLKAENAKMAAKKAEEDKLKKEKELAEKTEKGKFEKAKADSLKAEKAKMAAKKAEEDKLNKEKALAEKAAADKLKKAKDDSLKAAKAKVVPKKAADTTKKKEPEVVKTKTAPTPTTTPTQNTSGNTTTNTGTSGSGGTTPSGGGSKHTVRKQLGVDKYKDAITRANKLLTAKKYREARSAYEEALREKPDDAYAKGKIADIDKILESLKK